MSSYAQKKYNFKFKPPVKVEKPKIVHIPNPEWKEQKYQLFKWAENEVAKKGYSGDMHNLLKEIINCSDQKGITRATIETFHNRMVARHGKGAPSRRTIERYLAKMVEEKTISRSTQETFKGLIKTRLIGTKLAMRSTTECRTEYISTKKIYIYEKGDTSRIAAFPSTSNHIYKNQSPKPASATALGASSLAGGEVVKRISLEEGLANIKRFKETQGR